MLLSQPFWELYKWARCLMKIIICDSFTHVLLWKQANWSWWYEEIIKLVWHNSFVLLETRAHAIYYKQRYPKLVFCKIENTCSIRHKCWIGNVLIKCLLFFSRDSARKTASIVCLRNGERLFGNPSEHCVSSHQIFELCCLIEQNSSCTVLVSIPRTNEIRKDYTGVSRRPVGWSVCEMLFHTPPAIFKSFKWNLLHMILMTCRCTWSGVMPLFVKILVHPFISCDKVWIWGYTRHNQ